jgi:hypothetical protein
MVSQYGVIQLSDTIGLKVRFHVVTSHISPGGSAISTAERELKCWKFIGDSSTSK